VLQSWGTELTPFIYASILYICIYLYVLIYTYTYIYICIYIHMLIGFRVVGLRLRA
jgi:hypothetical protein